MSINYTLIMIVIKSVDVLDYDRHHKGVPRPYAEAACLRNSSQVWLQQTGTPMTNTRKELMNKLPSVLITGASSGIGATYAERFARRGHDLVLVARDKARLNALAARLREESGVTVEVLLADLTQAADLTALEARLRDDVKIGILINNAGMPQVGGFLTQSAEAIESQIALNTTALTRLAAAVAPRFAQSGSGSIVNIGSVLGFAPEFGTTIYGATKAFVLFLSQGLHQELSSAGVYVQAVLPAATRTEIWERAGVDVNTLPEVMEVGELVDAALVGFDRRELVTIPPLHIAERWDALEGARQGLMAGLRQDHAAERYLHQ